MNEIERDLARRGVGCAGFGRNADSPMRQRAVRFLFFLVGLMTGLMIAGPSEGQYYHGDGYGYMGERPSVTSSQTRFYGDDPVRRRNAREQIGQTIFDHSTGEYHILRRGVPGCAVAKCGYSLDKW